MKIRNIILYSLFLFFILEGTLRIQQAFGPIYDLALDSINLDTLSDVLNHKHSPGKQNILFEGERVTRYYDKNGIRLNQLRPKFENNTDAFKILFMGDSFMEGYDDPHTTPQHIWDYLQATKLHNKDMSFLNAGHASYSPAIFIPQAKMLIPRLRPDFVVLDIDETDLGDDFLRYRALIVRNSQGKIEAVKHTPIHALFLKGFIKIRRQPLYLTRLILKIYHTKIRMPKAIREYRADDPELILSFSSDKSKNAREKYVKEISFFKENMRELAEALIYLMKDKERIFFIYHPRLEHIQPDADGLYWNNFVRDVVKDVAGDYGIAFYDATEDLREAFNDGPQKYYWPGNMHFNFKGSKIYAFHTAEKLIPQIERFIK